MSMQQLKIIFKADSYENAVTLPISDSRMMSLKEQNDDTPETLACVEKIVDIVTELLDIMAEPEIIKIEEA